MNNLKILNAFLLLCFLVLSACRKDVIMDETVIIDPSPTVFIDGSVSGLVLDLQGTPISAATVSMGINVTTSDENGVFSFNDISMNEKGALVTAEKEGYFYNAKFVFPTLNKRSFTRFKMIERVLSSTFSANSGGTTLTNGNAKITIPANSIRDESGNLYSGNVNFYATWIDPTGENLLYEMPGDLRGQNNSNEQVQLISYGMIGVELEDDNGTPLNIVDGKTATIELPVPVTLLGAAPATIPLWHFNETTGIWEEEGEANLENGVYVGTVGHFSFWNVDVPNPLVNLTGSVLSQGKGVGDLLVKIISEGNGTAGTGFTNNAGVFSGFIPANEQLTIIILNACDEVLYTGQIGPFSDDAMIDPIQLPDGSIDGLLISGRLQDCEFNGIGSSYVRVAYNDVFSIIPTSASGEFASIITICSATEVTIKGFDLVNFKESQSITFNVTDSTSLDLGMLNACDDLSEFYEATIGNVTWFYDTSQILSVILDETGYFELFAGYNNPSTIGLFTNLIKMNNAAQTNTPMMPYNFSASTDDFGGWCFEPNISCSGVTVTLESAEFTNPGDILQGSYEGISIDASVGGETRAVSGNFRFIKD